MEKKKISVIVPIYNVEKYLERCIDSLIDQSYRNIEIILVDDGSPDRCPQICDAYAHKDSRIKVIHKENAGVASARNAGLYVATGEYIGFVDSDDWVSNEMYQILYEDICRYEADIACCGYSKVLDGKINNEDYFEQKKCVDRNEAAQLFFQPYCLQGYYTSNCNKIFKYTCICPKGKMIEFEEGVLLGEDERWLMEVLCNSNRVSLNSEQHYYYNYMGNENSASANAKAVNIKHRIDEVDTSKLTYETMKTNGFSKDVIRFAAYRCYMHAYLFYKVTYINQLDVDLNYLRHIIEGCEKDYLKSGRDSFLGVHKKKVLLKMMYLKMPVGLVKLADKLTTR